MRSACAAGFVYKTEDDLISNNFQPFRRPSAFTVPFTFARHRAGRRGAAPADDRDHHDVSASRRRRRPTSRRTTVVMNVDQYSRYKTVEVSHQQALQQPVVGVDRRRAHVDDATSRTASQRNPNNARRGGPHDLELQGDGQLRRAVWHPDLAGAASPVGLQLRPDGDDLVRRPASSHVGGTATSGTLAYVEPMNANREDNIWVFDIRAEKTVELHRAHARARCSSTCSTSRTATRRRRSAAPRAWATSVRPRFSRRAPRASASASSGKQVWGPRRGAPTSSLSRPIARLQRRPPERQFQHHRSRAART